jgi:hypothetical protein
MIVQAACLAVAWDSIACKRYEPGMGPLADGRYEIDTDSQLVTLTTIRGEWVFQYPGHEGKDPNYDIKRKAIIARGEVAVPAAVASESVPVSEKPKQKMTEAHKKKMADGRARRKAELATA